MYRYNELVGERQITRLVLVYATIHVFQTLWFVRRMAVNTGAHMCYLPLGRKMSLNFSPFPNLMPWTANLMVFKKNQF